MSGVPQGSVLGPLLFTLYVNSLPSFVNSAMCDTYLFADDVFLLFSGCFVFEDVLVNNINFELGRVLEWTSRNSLTINPSKTKAIMFGPTNRFILNPDVFLDGVRIDFVNHLKCLGIILDNRLSFANHIDMLSCKLFNILRRIYSSNLFLPFRVKTQLSWALLMSQILYGFEVFSGTCAMNLKRVHRLINVIVRFVYNIRRRQHISHYFCDFIGCTFEQFVMHRNLILFHKVIKSNKPFPLCRSFTFSRSTRNPQIIIPRISSSFFEKSFMVRIARWWNQLPVSLRIFSHSNNAFRLKLWRCFSSL